MDKIVDIKLDNIEDLLMQDLSDKQTPTQQGENKANAMNNLNFEDIREVITEDKKVEFDRRFYISYLGININTIFSEDINFLKVLIYLNEDKEQIDYILKDLDLFIPYAEELYLKNQKIINKEISQVALSKLKQFQTELKYFLANIQVLSMKNNKLMQNIGNENKETLKDIVTMLNSKNYYTNVVATLKRDVTNKEGIVNLLKYILKRVELEELVNEYMNSDEKQAELTDYIKSSYMYTKKDKETLLNLGFLNIFGDEVFLKPKSINTKRKTSIESYLSNEYRATLIVFLMNSIIACNILNKKEINTNDRINLIKRFYTNKTKAA